MHLESLHCEKICLFNFGILRLNFSLEGAEEISTNQELRSLVCNNFEFTFLNDNLQ